MLCHLPLLFPVAGLVLFAFLPFPVALAVYLPFAALSAVFRASSGTPLPRCS